MAKLEKKVTGDFSEILHRIEDGIVSGSVSANLEESSDFCMGDVRCSVRVFERFSFMGNNRVSLSVTLFGNGDTGHHLGRQSGCVLQAQYLWRGSVFG